MSHPSASSQLSATQFLRSLKRSLRRRARSVLRRRRYSTSSTDSAPEAPARYNANQLNRRYLVNMGSNITPGRIRFQDRSSSEESLRRMHTPAPPYRPRAPAPAPAPIPATAPIPSPSIVCDCSHQSGHSHMGSSPTTSALSTERPPAGALGSRFEPENSTESSRTAHQERPNRGSRENRWIRLPSQRPSSTSDDDGMTQGQEEWLIFPYHENGEREERKRRNNTFVSLAPLLRRRPSPPRVSQEVTIRQESPAPAGPEPDRTMERKWDRLLFTLALLFLIGEFIIRLGPWLRSWT